MQQAENRKLNSLASLQAGQESLVTEVNSAKMTAASALKKVKKRHNNKQTQSDEQTHVAMNYRRGMGVQQGNYTTISKQSNDQKGDGVGGWVGWGGGQKRVA